MRTSRAINFIAIPAILIAAYIAMQSRAADMYPHAPFTLNVPCSNASPITPSDTVALAANSRFIYVGVAGDITLIPQDGSTGVLFKAVPAGTQLQVRASQVMATGTTATNLVDMW